MTELPEDRNALWVKPSSDGLGVSVAMYRVPAGTDIGQEGDKFLAKFLAGIILRPEQAYKIAQSFTLTAMKVEENRKNEGLE